MRLLALHGYSQGGAAFRDALSALPLPAGVTLACPDAPFPADPARFPAGARTWWDASDDGAVYRGWEVSRDRLRDLLTGEEPTVLLGFSQGAMLTALACAWSARGELPAVAGAVLVAGAVPRALDLKPVLEVPIDVPSLHVWGRRDDHAKYSALLAERFVAPELREWDGPHVVPTRGPGAEAILAFLAKVSAKA